MKIVEKKCPNCGANLKFHPGEHEAKCPACRREFIIEYDANGDLADEKQDTNPKDFSLIPAAKVFGTVFAVQSIIITIASVLIIGAVFFGMIHIISSFNSMHSPAKTDTTTSEESDQQYQNSLDALTEQYQKSIEQMNQDYQDSVDQMNKDYQESVDAMQRSYEESKQ